MTLPRPTGMDRTIIVRTFLFLCMFMCSLYQACHCEQGQMSRHVPARSDVQRTPATDCILVASVRWISYCMVCSYLSALARSRYPHISTVISSRYLEYVPDRSHPKRVRCSTFSRKGNAMARESDCGKRNIEVRNATLAD